MSACLTGLRTRYDGSSRPHPLLDYISKNCIVVQVCPETLGGMGIPRPASRFMGGDGTAVLRGNARVEDAFGKDRTPEFVRGAEETLAMLRLVGPELIIFKEGSPSCGVRRIDLAGAKTAGVGVATALLSTTGIPIITEEDELPF
ncbi:DUF523 domain-containing protein [Desulfomonile tiedjei]|nr:DUF523 domain-containing protein [Desulfomonile tiedjei]